MDMFQSCLVLEGLDVEPEGGRDGVDVLPVELLQDRRLARVVKPSVDGNQQSSKFYFRTRDSHSRPRHAQQITTSGEEAQSGCIDDT